MKWVIKPVRNAHDDFDLFIGTRDDSGRMGVAEPFITRVLEPGVMATPTLVGGNFVGLSVREFLKACVEAAADVGIFSERSGNEREIAALKEHLRDMRKIALEGLPGTDA